MADSLSTTITAKIDAKFKNTLTGTTAVVDAPISISVAKAFADGTSANQADKCWASKGRTLSTSGTEDIDLYDLGTIDIGTGAGGDPLGQSVTYAEIVAIWVENKSTSTGNIFVGGKAAGTAQFNTIFGVAETASDTAQVGPIYPGGGFLIYAPTDPAYLVADTTNHLLAITEDGTGAVTYDIMVIARSA